MGWYMAVLVRGSHVNGVLDDERLGDMLYRLVRAPDSEAAYARAMELGRAAVDTITDDDGAPVTLEFLGLADLTEIPSAEIGDGVEVYSQLLGDGPSHMVVEKEELTVFEREAEQSPESAADEPLHPK